MKNTLKNTENPSSKKGGISVARPKSKRTLLREIEKKKAEIKSSLETQLRALGADVPHFYDLINTYITLWGIKKQLEIDIDERGIRYDEKMSTGLTKSVINPAIKELENTTKQMLAILKEMNLTTSEATGEEDEDEGL